MQVFVVGSFVVACSVMVARLPRAGESLDAAAFVSEPGGKGFNLAVAAHRLGAGVSGAFAVGDDSFAAVATSAFRAAGLSVDMLVRREGSTGAGIGFVDSAGENCLAVSLGANRLLSGSDVERIADGLDRSRLVLATFESPDEPIRTAFGRARANGASTLLNPSPSRTIDPAILGNTTILVVNQIEAGDLGIDPGKASTVDRFLEAGPEIIVVTLGEEGAIAFRKDQPPYRQPAFRVSVVDTIGAGDAFAAGLAVSLMQGLRLEASLWRATACGALTTRRLGAFDAFPTTSELDGFLSAVTAELEA